MKNVVRIVILFMLISGSFISDSLCLGNNFRYLRTNEGLYSGEINSIAQDQSGRMWFATWTGVANYNGFDFNFFKPELGNSHSLPDKKTHRIFFDSNDLLWIASLSGVSIYRNSDYTFHPIRFEGQLSSSFYVIDILEVPGFIVIHTNAGFFLLDQKSIANGQLGAKRLLVLEGSQRVNDYVHFAVNFGGKFFLVSNKDAYSPDRIKIAELKVSAQDTSLQVVSRQNYSRQINTAFFVEKESKLFLGTSDGIAVIKTNQGYQIEDLPWFKGTNVQELVFASNNRLYGSGTVPELLWAEPSTGKTGKYVPDPLKPGSLLDNYITCLFEDYSGNLWVGHQGLGLSILNMYQKAFYSFYRDPYNAKSLGGNIVMCFNSTSTEVLVGMRQDGINVGYKKDVKAGISDFSAISHQKRPLASSTFNRVWDIAKESETVFWVASDGGVDKLEKTSEGWMYGKPGEEPLFSGGTVRKILIDKDKNLWFGPTDSGVLFFPALNKNSEKKFFSYPFDPENASGISDRTILSIMIDSQQRFWIGTNNGLNLLKTPYNQLDLSGKSKPELRFEQFVAVKPDNDYLSANEINCIFENTDGKIWIATQGGGISIYDPTTRTFTTMTVEDGLPGSDIQGILSDHAGVKWISSNKGLAAFDAKNQAKPFTYYNSHADGLQGETFKVNSYYKSNEGQLFFGGDNGFTTFLPAEIKSNPIPPKIGLTHFRIDNVIINVGDTISKGNIFPRSIDLIDEIKLPSTKNSFSVGVGVNHFQHPEGNEIRYKLDGFYDNWISIPASNRFAYFSKIPPGKYTLHISGISSDNVQAETEKTILITILPPWYQTWFFRVLILFLLVVFVGYLFYYLAGKQRETFEKKIDAITFESNENKMRFLTNIAHELRTPLSLVIAPIEDMKQNYKNIDSAWKNHLSLIYRNSNYLLTLINQIIDFRKLNAGKLQLNLQTTDIAGMVKEVVSNFKGLEGRRKTQIITEIPASAILVDIDRQKIEEVLYNLLSNAFKHTIEKGTIKVSLQVQNTGTGDDAKSAVRITVFNEGKDISDEDKKRIFEQFYKVSEKVEGAGIGLSFSKSLIEMHNGTIAVESVDGIGVAFHVDLPFDQIEVTDVAQVNEESDSALWHDDFYNSAESPGIENTGKDMTLVIVEDNADLRAFLNNTLSGSYNCYEAADGKEGYDLITKLIPDIIISDVVMPKMDGYELCTKVKENSKTCHIPVILLTAKNAAEHIVSGYEKGADAYVTKPFDMSIIKAQILRLIKNRELIREKYMTQNFMVEIMPTNLSKDDEFIVRLRQLLEDNLSESDFNVKKLSEDMNISTTHLYRKLKALTGLSPVEFIRVFKLQKACEMLSNTNQSIKEIGYGLGFNNLSYFVKCFREQFGVTPTTYRQKGLPNKIENDSTNQSVMS